MIAWRTKVFMFLTIALSIAVIWSLDRDECSRMAMISIVFGFCSFVSVMADTF